MKGRRLGLLLILLALQSLAEGCVFQVRIDDSIIFEKDLTVALGNAYSSHPFIVSALIKKPHASCAFLMPILPMYTAHPTHSRLGFLRGHDGRISISIRNLCATWLLISDTARYVCGSFSCNVLSRPTTRLSRISSLSTSMSRFRERAMIEK